MEHHLRSAQVRIIQCYLQTSPYLPYLLWWYYTCAPIMWSWDEVTYIGPIFFCGGWRYVIVWHVWYSAYPSPRFRLEYLWVQYDLWRPRGVCCIRRQAVVSLGDDNSPARWLALTINYDQPLLEQWRHQDFGSQSTATTLKFFRCLSGALVAVW